MGCQRVNIPGGGVAIVCSDTKKCAVCRKRAASKLCDGPGKKPGATCDVQLCTECAEHHAPDKDLCPAHATGRTHVELHGLTLHRPWSWCFSDSDKALENRGWAPPPKFLDQWIAIHGGKTLDEEGAERLRRWGLRVPEDGGPQGIVCVARLVGYVRGQPGAVVFPEGKRGELVRAAFEGQERWFVGEYGWVFDQRIRIEPVPCKGAQGLWTVPEAVVQTVRVRFGAVWRARRAG